MLTTFDNFSVEYEGSMMRFSSPYRKLWLNIFGTAIVLFTIISLFIFLFYSFAIKEIDILFILDNILMYVVLFFIADLLSVEFLWLVIGIEVIEVGSDSIILKHQVFGIGISKKLLPNKIDGVFLSQKDDSTLSYLLSGRETKFFNFKKGMVAINYGKSFLGDIKTYRFGSNLNEEGAKQIVKMIHDRFPQYIYRGSKKTA